MYNRMGHGDYEDGDSQELDNDEDSQELDNDEDDNGEVVSYSTFGDDTSTENGFWPESDEEEDKSDEESAEE